MKYILFVLVFLLVAPHILLAAEDAFHAPETAAEKAMDDILVKADKGEEIKAYLTQRFLSVWHQRPADQQGLRALVCSDDGYNTYATYQTLHADDSSATISYTAYNRPYNPLYRLVKEDEQWKVDGVYCDETLNIGMDEEVSKYCQSLSDQGMTTELCDAWDFHKEKAALEATLASLKERYADNPEGLAKIQKAQETWDAFVKAQLDLLYFDHGGSVIAMCRRNDMSAFVHDRNKQLRQWIESSTVEGDVCGGL